MTKLNIGHSHIILMPTLGGRYTDKEMEASEVESCAHYHPTSKWESQYSSAQLTSNPCCCQYVTLRD